MMAASVEKLYNCLRPCLQSVDSFSASDGDLSDWCDIYLLLNSWVDSRLGYRGLIRYGVTEPALVLLFLNAGTSVCICHRPQKAQQKR
jgi:hypothetical protein